jgi:myo-inositol-1(or 4)-monophosphatase
MTIRGDADHELGDVEAFAVDLALRGGEILEGLYAGPLDVRFKSTRDRDPVTAADDAVENLVRTAVTERFPDHGVLGEEGSERAGTSGYLWVVDPLDGTANFANGLPVFAVSIGVLRDGAPVAAALWTSYGPQGRPAVLHAAAGSGLKVGGAAFTPPARRLSGRARLAGVPAGYHRGFGYRFLFGVPPGETRSLGSIAVELGLVATGALQYALFQSPKLWDVAAGVLLVREAGGLVWTDEAGHWRRLDRFVAAPGKPLREWKQAVVAGDPSVLSKEIRRLRVRHTPLEVAERALGSRRGPALRRFVEGNRHVGRRVAQLLRLSGR